MVSCGGKNSDKEKNIFRSILNTKKKEILEKNSNLDQSVYSILFLNVKLLCIFMITITIFIYIFKIKAVQLFKSKNKKTFSMLHNFPSFSKISFHGWFNILFKSKFWVFFYIQFVFVLIFVKFFFETKICMCSKFYKQKEFQNEWSSTKKKLITK